MTVGEVLDLVTRPPWPTSSFQSFETLIELRNLETGGKITFVWSDITVYVLQILVSLVPNNHRLVFGLRWPR